MSDVQAELVKVTKVKPKKNESDQDFRKRLMAAVDDKLADSDWANLSEEAQTWCNDSAKALKKKADLPDFPDAASEEDDDEDEDEDEKPAKKAEKKSAKKDTKAGGKKASKKAEEDDEEDDEDEDEDEDESEDEDDADEEHEDGDVDEDDDDDEEDEKPAKKSSKKSSKDEKPAKKTDKKVDKKADKAADKKPAKRGTGVTASIKQIMLVNPHIELEDLMAKLQEKGFDPISQMTVSTVRADFRHTLKIMHESSALGEALTKKMDKGKK